MSTSLFKTNAYPYLGIIGRPNVGKSTLFNALIRKKKSIVKNKPGVTRDFLLGLTNWHGCHFNVVDTGGVTKDKSHFLSYEIRSFLFSHLNQFDLLILVMDGKSGLLLEEKEMLWEVKKKKIPFLVVVNKIDSENEASTQLSEFYELEIESLLPASFEKKWGLDKIVSWIVQNVSKKKWNHKTFLSSTNEKKVLKEREDKDFFYRLVVAGQPNVGKSLFVNKILGFKRMLVSDQEGTTRDSVESFFHWKDFSFCICDTAGLKRKTSRTKDLESLTAFLSERSIEAADIVLLVVDVTRKEITRQDLRLAQYALKRNKALILVANKMDQTQGSQGRKKFPAFRQNFRKKLKEAFHFFQDIPLVFASAKTGLGVKNFFQTLEEICYQLDLKISTPDLNRFLKKNFSPSSSSGKKSFKFFYLTQTGHRPPSFMIFAKNAKSIPLNKKRFLKKKIQKEWNLNHVPLRLFFKEKT